jgi:DNA-binding NarL/FixJ family response regulator
VAAIRAAFVTTPAMLGDLIKALARGRIEFEVVAKFDERRGWARKLRSARPNLVVIGLQENESSAAVLPMLVRVPRAKFIAFSNDGREAFGFELRIQHMPLTDLSPNSLIDFIGSFI